MCGPSGLGAQHISGALDAVLPNLYAIYFARGCLAALNKSKVENSDIHVGEVLRRLTSKCTLVREE